MEETIKKVEEVLNTLKCGLKFKKTFNSDGSVYFTCYDKLKLQVYGISYQGGIRFYVWMNNHGYPSVDRWGVDETNGMELCKREEIELLREKSGLSERGAEKVFEAIIRIQSEEQERLFQAVTEEFETRLPDVDIVDRTYPE